jgi:signal transduction histidine kinase/CheY-like chemotaxis protein
MGNFSIKKKNITIILTVVLFSIVTTIAVPGIQNIRNFRKELTSRIASATKVIISNSVVAIDFEDKEHGEKILSSLEAIPEVSGAVIFDKNNKEFVCYKKEAEVPFGLIEHLQEDTRFESNYLYLSEKIRYKGEHLGTIYVIASTENLSKQIFNYLIFSLMLLVVVFLVAALLGARLSKSLTGPILNLADTAAVISSEGDYSIRVKKTGRDEIGTLYDSFNEMLEQIAARDTEIRKLNEGLEDKVAERTRDLLKAKEQAEKARRAAELADRAKSTFLANMSHEIRTPMNAILGYSNLLMKQVSDKKQREYLEIVQESGKNLLSLINDILDLSKIESGKLTLLYKPMAPYHFFSEIKNIFRIRTEEKGIRFIIEVDPDIPPGLLMDETRLRQILFNVVGNAVKFTQKGRVKLSAKRKASKQHAGKINLLFKVADTGIGIPEGQQEDIFKAFEQQKDQGFQYGGAGLGLAITRRLVEIMNGTISVSSQVNKGTTFTIELRDIEISTLHIDAVSPMPSTERLRFDGANVLLVEDNVYNFKLVQAMLEEKHIRVEGAVDGKEALEKLKHFTPHLVLMDMKMAGMDGYEATKIIKTDDQLKHIPVIALTASAMKKSRQKVKEAGCSGFLAKPIDENQLFAELMKYLPYQEEEEKETASKADKMDVEKEEIDLSHLSPEALSEIVTVLSTQLMEQWHHLGESMLLDEWKQFGTKIKTLGETHNADFLEDYGRHIIENVEHLNVTELKKTIKHFPEVVETLKRSQT